LFAAVSHIPPAFSQSAFVVYFEKSADGEPELGDGLAEGAGDVEVPLDAPPDVEPPAPEVPDGALEPEPAAPVPLPLPLVLCAATSAGVSAMIATSRSPKNLVMVQTPFV
jgi:hypothetical protein